MYQKIAINQTHPINDFGLIKKVDIVIGIGAIIYGIYQFSQDYIDIVAIIVSILILVLCVGLYLYWIKPNSKSLEEKT